MEHIQFVGIGLTQELQSFHRFARLVLIDFAHGETYVNQHPVTRPNTLRSHKRHTHIASHAGDIHFGDRVGIIHDVYNLTWNTETHMQPPSRVAVTGQQPPPTAQDSNRHHWAALADL